MAEVGETSRLEADAGWVRLTEAEPLTEFWATTVPLNPPAQAPAVNVVDDPVAGETDPMLPVHQLNWVVVEAPFRNV